MIMKCIHEKTTKLNNSLKLHKKSREYIVIMPKNDWIHVIHVQFAETWLFSHVCYLEETEKQQ